jgi:sugar phosphate isomerase/epimerase
MMLAGAAAAPSGPKTRMGGTPTAFSLEMQAARKASQPFDLPEVCHRFGLGGVQTRVPTEPEAVMALREKLEKWGMYLVGDARPPRDASEVPAFEKVVEASKAAGASVLHAALTARRYEAFDTFEAFKENFQQCQKVVGLAEPVLRKHRVKLAVENHKGWRFAEHIAWLKRLSSEWVGVCVDVGNNISLCDDPMETVEAYAPYALDCHIKDMAVEEYPEGVLLAEVPMGEGIIDLHKVVDILRKANPNLRFGLEMITRDPLKVPVLTKKYWVTFDDSYSPLPGRDLARTLAMVRANRPKQPLPIISQLSFPDQVKAEEENNRKCIAYAREHLGL